MVVALLVLGGCNAGAPCTSAMSCQPARDPPDAGGTASGGGAAGGRGTVTVAVHGVDSPSKLGNIPPGSGRYYLVIDLTLTHVSAPAPVPAGPLAFTLRTGAGLVVTAAPRARATDPADYACRRAESRMRSTSVA